MRLLPPLQGLIKQSPYGPYHHPAHGLLLGLELRPILTHMLEEEFVSTANLDERKALMLDQAVKLFLADQYLAISYHDNHYLSENLARIVWDLIPQDARAAALTFLSATTQENSNNEKVNAAKETLIQHQCASLLTIPQKLRPYLLFKWEEFAQA